MKEYDLFEKGAANSNTSTAILAKQLNLSKKEIYEILTLNGRVMHPAILRAMEEAKATKGMPTAIIMKSVKGKGVSFMENNAGWHGKAPNDEEYQIAMKDLDNISAQLEGGAN